MLAVATQLEQIQVCRTSTGGSYQMLLKGTLNAKFFRAGLAHTEFSYFSSLLLFWVALIVTWMDISAKYQLISCTSPYLVFFLNIHEGFVSMHNIFQSLYLCGVIIMKD